MIMTSVKLYVRIIHLSADLISRTEKVKEVLLIISDRKLIRQQFAEKTGKLILLNDISSVGQTKTSPSDIRSTGTSPSPEQLPWLHTEYVVDVRHSG